MVSCDRSLTMSLCVLTAAAAVAVTGKPHARCSWHDDYAAAIAAAYYPPAALAMDSRTTAFELPPSSVVEYAGEEAPPFRSGRSNGHDPASDGPADAAAVEPDVLVKPTAAALDPCKGPSPVPQAQAANGTAALTAEKLTAYYDRLKAQQEMLARRQIEMQLLEQQQRRQREYALVQHQIQQQYYQQQQHAMAMLDQLHRNPAFVSQMAAYMEQRLKANNGTAVTKTAASAPEVTDTAVPDVTAAAAVTKAEGDDVGHGARSHVDDKVQNNRFPKDDDDEDSDDNIDEKDEKNEKDEKVEKDEKDGRGCDGVLPAKRVEPRQIAGRGRTGRRTFARDAAAWMNDFSDDHHQRHEDKLIGEKVYDEASE